MIEKGGRGEKKGRNNENISKKREVGWKKREKIMEKGPT